MDAEMLSGDQGSALAPLLPRIKNAGTRYKYKNLDRTCVNDLRSGTEWSFFRPRYRIPCIKKSYELSDAFIDWWVIAGDFGVSHATADPPNPKSTKQVFVEAERRMIGALYVYVEPISIYVLFA
jgi:hypothetical protein